MPGNSEECRMHAKCCFELAQASTNLALEQGFNDMAHQWTRLADDIETTLEATQRLLDKLDSTTHREHFPTTIELAAAELDNA